MEKENTTDELSLEGVCSVCQMSFHDLEILSCGHSFCDTCVVCCRKNFLRFFCTLCEKPSQKRNTKSGITVEMSMAEHARQGSKEGEICRKHKQPLILFCMQRKALLCSKCVESKKSPAVLGVGEAVREYKDRYILYAETIKEEKKEIMAHTISTETESKSLLEKVEGIKERMVSAFRETNKFLMQQEKVLLDQLEEVMFDIEKTRDQHVDRLLKRVTFLDSILKEMEKHHRTPNELLKNVRSTLEKFGVTFKSPVAFPPSMHWGLYQWQDLTFHLDFAIEKFKGTLVAGYKIQKVSVTLDPDVGDAQFSLSKDLKSLREGKPQDPSGSCDVFGRLPFVLGCNAFTTGRHYWEVTVRGEGDWAVGVARCSVKRRRKNRAAFNPTDGIWAIGKWKGGYTMFSSPKEPVPMNGEVLRSIRVSLNCDGKQVSFANADSDAVLAKFQTASFLEEPILPIFWVEGETSLCLSS